LMWWWRWRRADPLVPPVTVRTVTRRPTAVELDQVQSPQHRRKGCSLLPKTMGQIHLHPIFEGWFVILERDFYMWWDCILAAQEESYQTRARIWTVFFFTYSIVVWCTAVVKPFQVPRASVPKPWCTVDMQVIFPLKWSLIHAVVQHILLSWPDTFERAGVYRQERARRDENHRFISLARHILVKGQISLCIVVGFYHQVLCKVRPHGVGITAWSSPRGVAGCNKILLEFLHWCGTFRATPAGHGDPIWESNG
jgi:hypothetical protein